MVEANYPHLRRRLLSWFRRHQRDLPWRHSTDPYAIWISETMLQQTQVKTVLPYYGRFIDTFPTIGALASAPLQKVLRLWSGLGYYRRAENLHKAARQIRRQHDGIMPRQYHQLRALPGIGDYTAGALMSIAFGEKYPAVDGNVRRVLGRLVGAKSNAEIHAGAAKLVKTNQPGNLNQALMELGATICTPREPRCAKCPVASLCRGRNGRGRMEAAKAPAKFRAVTWPQAIVVHNNKILLRRRQSRGLLAKLWELPGSELAPTADIASAMTKELRSLRLGRAQPERLGELRHSITDRRITAPVLLYRWPVKHSAPPDNANWRWIAPTELHRYPTSSLTAKAVKQFIDHEKSSA